MATLMAPGHSPARLSPLHALHVELGAIFADAAGWHVVQRYGDVEGELEAVARSAGVCDISGRSVVRIKSARLDDAPGSSIPMVGSVRRHGDSLMARLTDDEALAIGPPSVDARLLDGIKPVNEPMRYLIDVTSGLVGLVIAGPRARDVLAALTDLDLRDGLMPDGSCAQAGFAQVHGTLLRLDMAGAAAYELYIAREYGVYMWEAVLEAGAVPFGAEALAALEQGR